METKSNSSKKGLLAAAVLIVLIVIFAVIYMVTRPTPETGNKTIQVEVIHSDESTKTFEYKTDAEYLAEVLKKEGLIAGEESEYGLFVLTVDGYTVDDSKQEWWSLSVNGEDAQTGSDSVVVTDGDVYTWTLMTGYN